ncbi:MAG: hypothetical protein KDA21_03860 [Phycisphaerales bacterium]|nr:hypothetical protein [Phycisphaerales bacterium]
MNQQTSTGERRTLNGAAAALWASAFVIMALIIIQAGQVGTGPNAAWAETISDVGDYEIMTVPVGNLEEVLVVLDSRDETIYTYATSARAVELQDFRNVREMFELAQNRGNPKR